jgi:Flp pilus assembly protein TadG
MKSPYCRGARYGHNDGQVLVLFLLFSVVLILFVGLGIDLGFAYVTKAQLSKALDASTLAAVSNYTGADALNGSPIAIGIANATFYANYATNGVSGRAATAGQQVTPVGTFTTDAFNNLTYSNTVSTQIHTYFIGLLPQWKTLTVGDTAVATRAPVVMTLVLDRTGSMDPNASTGNCKPGTQGGKFLPGAVTDFINIFDETLDRAALVTFSISAVNDVPMTTPPNGVFKKPIISTVNGLNWGGNTCSIAGLTNALVIQNNVNVTSNYVKVVVFFTDGRANTTMYKFPTIPKGGITLSFGGNDPLQASCPPFPDPGASFWRTNGNNSGCNSINCGDVFPICPIGGGTNITSTQVWTNALGIEEFFCASKITEDATNRCVLVASQMRASGNYVYAVGLTAGVNAFAPPTIETLDQIANDPDSSTFDSSKPVGAAFLSHGEDLSEVFQQVAADIILRLVR